MLTVDLASPEICRKLGFTEQTFYRSSDDMAVGGKVPPVTLPVGEDLYYRDPRRFNACGMPLFHPAASRSYSALDGVLGAGR